MRLKIDLYWLMVAFIFAMIVSAALTRVCYNMGRKEARDEVNTLWVTYLDSNGIKWWGLQR